jgi:hypothetical protein
MRGRFFDQGGMFSYIRPEQRIPANHPLRNVRELVREVLRKLNQISLAFLAPKLVQAAVEGRLLAASASRVCAMLLPSGPSIRDARSVDLIRAVLQRAADAIARSAHRFRSSTVRPLNKFLSTR